MPTQQLELEEIRMAETRDQVLEEMMNLGSYWGPTSSTSKEGCGSNCL